MKSSEYRWDEKMIARLGPWDVFLLALEIGLHICCLVRRFLLAVCKHHHLAAQISLTIFLI
jgi:hypothetical protein